MTKKLIQFFNFRSPILTEIKGEFLVHVKFKYSPGKVHLQFRNSQLILKHSRKIDDFLRELMYNKITDESVILYISMEVRYMKTKQIQAMQFIYCPMTKTYGKHFDFIKYDFKLQQI